MCRCVILSKHGMLMQSSFSRSALWLSQGRNGGEHNEGMQFYFASCTQGNAGKHPQLIVELINIITFSLKDRQKCLYKNVRI